jgi:hypothetical protein
MKQMLKHIGYWGHACPSSLHQKQMRPMASLGCVDAGRFDGKGACHNDSNVFKMVGTGHERVGASVEG